MGVYGGPLEVHWGSVGGRVCWREGPLKEGSVGVLSVVCLGVCWKYVGVCGVSKVFHEFIHPMIEFLTTLCRHSRRVFKPFRIPAVAVGMHQGTNNGREKATSQILYGQYHIWELFGSCMF